MDERLIILKINVFFYLKVETDFSGNETSAKPIKKLRKSFTVKEKLEILKYVRPGVPGKSIRAVGKQQGLDESTLRSWVKNQSGLEKFRKNNDVQIHQRRHLPGGGRKAYFPELEAEVISWVLDRNSAGLRVKDKLIGKKAMSLKEEKMKIVKQMEMSEDPSLNLDDAKKLKEFTASVNWIQRFKDRHKLVSRRHTTTRNLPADYAEKARLFVLEVQKTIEEKGIDMKNIINFDQVPRYFELNINSTLITKGTQKVHLRKASTSHRRFTFTPFITAEGKFIGLHFLFSKLKNVPTVAAGCVADVNQTGMWSEETMKSAMKNIILNRSGALFSNPTLIILDSYGSHLKFVEKFKIQYEKKNIFFKFVPACLTGNIVFGFHFSLNNKSLLKDFYNHSTLPSTDRSSSFSVINMTNT